MMADTKTNHIQYYDSPVGWLKIAATDHELMAVEFYEKKENDSDPNNITRQTAQQLQEYFEKKRTVFNLPLSPTGTTFQQKVWNELQNIPFGKTRSYMELSKTIGDVKAIRAVGRANGQNPIPIIIPCHRVIGSDGSLTGYGGGIWRKKWLLQHEGLLPQMEIGF